MKHPESGVGDFPRLMEIVVPEGGSVVAFAEVYVDESGTHAGSDVMVVAGYIFRRTNARRFQADWARILRREGIPYFHMTDCATGNGHFKNWSVERRLNLEKKLIALTKRDSAFGFAIGLRPSAFNRALPGTVAPYSFLLNHCLLTCQRWAINNDFKNRFAYFFEAGHASQGQASEIMSNITATEHVRAAAQYHSHSFIPKDGAAPLQAADLLAWLSRNAIEKREAGKVPRKDFLALKRDQDLLQYFDEIELRSRRRNDFIAQAIAKGRTHTWYGTTWGETQPANWPHWPKPDE